MTVRKYGKMCGKSWEQNHQIIISPMIPYGSVLWWPRTQQLDARTLLSSIQILQSVSIMEGMKNTAAAT